MNMHESDEEELPPELVEVRDATVASAFGEGPLPKGADELFNWLFWQANGMDFDNPYFNLDGLDLDDYEARAELELADDEQLSDQQRLEYARHRIERILRDNDFNFAHAYRIETQDGRFTYLCGMSSIAGQGGPDTSCDGTYPSKQAYLSTFEEGGWCNESAETISMEAVLKHWRR